jgi:hypothetical protein
MTEELRPPPLCDVCGQVVPPDDAYSAELSAGDMMCPAPMVFHKGCYERASGIWQPDPDSYCTTDPLFPETARWTAEQQAQG